MTHDLTPIDPRTALESYLQDRENELSPNTLRSHESRLTPFIEWCEETAGLDSLHELTGRHVHEYKVYRFDEKADGGSYSPVTVKTQLDTIRRFTRWLASVDAVPTDLPSKIRSPNVGEHNQRSDMLEIKRAKGITAYLDRYQYASLEHVLLAVSWETGCRIGGAHSLDVDDCRLDPEDRGPYLVFEHRPNTGTALKNGSDGDRPVAVSDELSRIIEDYLANARKDVTDEYGRTPLFTSSHGRYHKNTLRNIIYGVTRPCVVSGECPHAEPIDECEAARRRNDACKCPSSKGPHSIRRASITHMLREGAPVQVVSDRANVGVDTLRDHYDMRSQKEQMDVRREHLPDFYE